MAIIEQEQQPILEIVRELKKRLLDLRNDMEKFVNAPSDVEPDSKPTPYLQSSPPGSGMWSRAS